jgi:hypothetical protein
MYMVNSVIYIKIFLKREISDNREINYKCSRFYYNYIEFT